MGPGDVVTMELSASLMKSVPYSIPVPSSQGMLLCDVLEDGNARLEAVRLRVNGPQGPKKGSEEACTMHKDKTCSAPCEGCFLESQTYFDQI